VGTTFDLGFGIVAPENGDKSSPGSFFTFFDFLENLLISII
jgi:hypothetical protein